MIVLKIVPLYTGNVWQQAQDFYQECHTSHDKTFGLYLDLKYSTHLIDIHSIIKQHMKELNRMLVFLIASPLPILHAKSFFNNLKCFFFMAFIKLYTLSLVVTFLKKYLLSIPAVNVLQATFFIAWLSDY